MEYIDFYTYFIATEETGESDFECMCDFENWYGSLTDAEKLKILPDADLDLLDDEVNRFIVGYFESHARVRAIQ